MDGFAILAAGARKLCDSRKQLSMDRFLVELVENTKKHTISLIELQEIRWKDAREGVLKVMDDLALQWPNCADRIREEFESWICDRDAVYMSETENAAPASDHQDLGNKRA